MKGPGFIEKKPDNSRRTRIVPIRPSIEAFTGRLNVTDSLDVLYIDNDQSMVSEYEKMSKEANCSFKVVTDPKVGLETILKENPKIVFVEMDMPDVDGLKIAIKFSEEKLFESSEIYLLSKKHMEEIELFSVRTLGFSEVIQKPLKKDKLLKILKHSTALSRPKAA